MALLDPDFSMRSLGLRNQLRWWLMVSFPGHEDQTLLACRD